MSFLPLPKTPTAHAKSIPNKQSTLAIQIINQVRGEECCDVGTLTAFQQQAQLAQELNIPASFSIRYDALKNPTWKATLQRTARSNPQLLFGILLEITPELAQDAGVEYKGTPETWYQAHHAFLIGYEPEERKKIVRTLFSAWDDVFSSPPALSSAWMVDTDTLGWIHQEYGIEIHQITREQWGVDSYTLHGGPPHYPYQAGREWLFRPATSGEDALGVWIVRQTVTDPVRNYGDTTSAFTSQPNDYSRDGKTIEYFKKLVKQAGNQPMERGYILLGLENSMGENYQKDYAEQLKWLVNQCKNEYNCIYIDSLSDIKQYYDPAVAAVTAYCGDGEGQSSGEDTACWITAPNYRLRISRSTTAAAITDFRIFSAGLEDPYNHKVSQNQGYWVVPGVLDAAVWPGEPAKPPFLARLLGPPEVKRLLQPPQNDFPLPPTRLNLFTADPANTNLEVVRTQGNSNSITLTYGDTKLEFLPDKIITTSSKAPQAQIALAENVPLKHTTQGNNFTLAWQTPEGQTSQQLTQECAFNLGPVTCTWTPSIQPELFHPLRDTQYAWWLPESLARPLSKEHTSLYAHNRYAIAGRNPVRLVLQPGDAQGFPTTLSSPPTLTASPEIAYSSQKTANEKDKTDTTIFIDLIHNSPQKSAVTVTLNPELTLTTNVYFAPNCKQELQYCLTHPRQTWWWLNTVVRDKLRATLLNEQQ